MKKRRGINRIVKYLIYSDLVFYTGWGLISPIFAVFILESVVGGTALVAGMAAAIHLILRSIVRVPFGMYADKSQKTSYNFMFWGLLASSFVPLGFIISRFPWQIYLFQGLIGITLALSSAGWAGIFAKYMDRGRESTEWGIDAVAVGLGPGIAAAVGGIMVTYFSFNWVFISVSILGIIGSLLLLFIKRDVLNSDHRQPRKSAYSRENRRIKKMRIP